MTTRGKLRRENGKLSAECRTTPPTICPPPPRPRLPVPFPGRAWALLAAGTVGEVHRDRLLALKGSKLLPSATPTRPRWPEWRAAFPRRPAPVPVRNRSAGSGGRRCRCFMHAPRSPCRTNPRRAPDAGVHVLCEKPFVTHAGEAAELVAQAREARLALFVAYTRRSRGHANFLLEAAGRIGPIENAVVLRSQPWLQTHRRTWRMHESEGGGFLLDAGVSMLDLLLRFTGSHVTTIDAQLWRPGGSLFRCGYSLVAAAGICVRGAGRPDVYRRRGRDGRGCPVIRAKRQRGMASAPGRPRRAVYPAQCPGR